MPIIRDNAKRVKRKADMRTKHHAKAAARKNQGMKGRTKKNDVGRDLSGAALPELVAMVQSGSVDAMLDVPDARSMANLLMATSADTGRLSLSNQKLAALPKDEETAKFNDARRAEEAAQVQVAAQSSGVANKYAHRGPSYAFWERAGLHEQLQSVLKDMKFTHPTPVQQETLPFALTERKDIVVSSETGSGKTLVFSLPVLHSVLSLKAPKKAAADAPKRGKGGKAVGKRQRAEDEAPAAAAAEADGARPVTKVLHTLVLSPTRELAMQIDETFKTLSKGIASINVACVVGGMAPSKQQRLLNNMPDVLICTPGRLWDLAQKNEGCFLGHSLSRRLQYVVLDEVDRLLQSHRFLDLQQILERVRCDVLPSGVNMETAEVEGDGGLCEGEFDFDTGEFTAKAKVAVMSRDRPNPMPMPEPPADDHRTVFFLTSATLSMQVNFHNKNHKEKQILRTQQADTMKTVLNDLGMKPSNVKVFDLAPKNAVVQQLQETYLRCTENARDLYLYYFLRTFEGRTIIFVNAISMLRRITKLLEILNIPAGYLHAAMQQKQRLNFIDKFKSGERRVMVATDVAARGLDVDDIRHVIHFQLPRSTDGYIHRCGRTARCGNAGFSALFVSPNEFTAFRQLQHSMARETPMEVFAIDQHVIRELHQHMAVANQIDQLTKESRKSNASQQWVNNMSAAADLDADDMVDESVKEANRGKAKEVKYLKRQLDIMLRRGFVGAKGSFRSAACALGANEAADVVKERAQRQVCTTATKASRDDAEREVKRKKAHAEHRAASKVAKRKAARGERRSGKQAAYAAGEE
jgi:ATP-dependent RNA helicase DDX24/MAK5